MNYVNWFRRTLPINPVRTGVHSEFARNSPEITARLDRWRGNGLAPSGLRLAGVERARFMHKRPIAAFHPHLERLERKQVLSVSPSTIALLKPKAISSDAASHPVDTSAAPGSASAVDARNAVNQTDQKPFFGFLVYRITNPTPFNTKLTPPFTQVLVQTKQPVPGETYNVMQVSVRNGTAQSFDASSGFRVRFPGQHASFPILTGSEQWKPGQVYVFYVLTHQYYPLPSQVQSGFEFDLGGARSVAIPGPSGIFLRLKYNPTTFAETLDWIVAHGPGTEGGKGVKYGLPVTSINEFVAAKTRRSDFGGYF